MLTIQGILFYFTLSSSAAMSQDPNETTEDFTRNPQDFIGKHIALWSPSNKLFLQMEEEGGVRPAPEDVNPYNIESWRTWERFEVVDGGNHKIAFHNSQHNRSLRLNGADINGHDGNKNADELPVNWGAERFTVIDAGDKKVAFYIRGSEKRFMRMSRGSVDGRGSVYDNNVSNNVLPSDTKWQIVLHPHPAPAPSSSSFSSASASASVAPAVMSGIAGSASTIEAMGLPAAASMSSMMDLVADNDWLLI